MALSNPVIEQRAVQALRILALHVKYLALKAEACRWRRRQPAVRAAEGTDPQLEAP